MSGDFTPDQSGDWQIALGSAGQSNLYFDGKLLVENSDSWTAGQLWFNMGSTEKIAIAKNLEAGKKYPIEVRCWFRPELRASPFKTAGAIRIGALPLVESEQAIADAVKIAQTADTTILVVGLNEDFETEGYDRDHME